MSEAVSEYKLECYQIRKPMGNKGNLWLVEDSVTGKQFVMHKLSRNQEKVYRILEELHHPNLTSITDVFCCHGFLYVIEEFIEGETLAQVLAKKGPSETFALSVAEQLLEVLGVLHAKGIIHRDIKPENLMLDTQGKIRLIDFDIARIFSQEKGADTTLKGSRAYAPPEQFGFCQTDQRADIYALGVTINELAAGRLPEDGVCGGFLGRVVRRCTEPDPQRRYQTAEQTLTQIGKLKKRKRNLALGAALLLGIAVALSMRIWQHPACPAFEELAGSYRGDWGIRRGRDIEQYPSVFLEDDGVYDCVVEMADGREIFVSMEKAPEQLVFSCALEGREPSVFLFDNRILKDPNLNIPFGPESYSSGFEYKFEILSPDYDGDGDREFVVMLGRCRWMEPPNPADTYLYVGYSMVWFVDLAEDGTWICCQEPYCEEGVPTFAQNFMICDPFNPLEGYRWLEGEWIYVSGTGTEK